MRRISTPGVPLLAMVASLLGACASNAPAGAPDGGGARGADAKPVDDGAVDVGPTPDGTSADAGAHALAGGWYSRVADADGGVGSRRRLRFDGATYYLLVDASDGYCVETGTFALTGDEVSFQPHHTEGFGHCVERAAHADPIVWTSDGFSLQSAGATVAYSPIRDVPKLFVTVESHNGNLLGDPLLPGKTAVEKADGVCNASLAKPDAGHYRAIFVDGVNRTLAPPKDWPLAPLTSYFTADGASNVLTTDRAASSYELQGDLLVSGAVGEYWTGIGQLMPQVNCNGWTASDSQSRGSTGDLIFHDYPLGRTSMSCDVPDQAFLCVGEGHSLRELAGPANLAPARDLQGSWHGSEDVVWPATQVRGTIFRTWRIDGADYRLVEESAGGYCGEIGKLEVGAGTVRFLPDRVDGVAFCTLGEVRTASFQRAGDMLTLTAAGKTATYLRAPDAPKVFVTFEEHDGAFARDAALPGLTAFAKADALCNQSTARPDGQTYKAVLVDGAGRGASPAVDWPLKPMTTYFYSDGVTPLFQTDAMALQVFASAKPFLRGAYSRGSAWSGLSGADASHLQDACLGWTTADAKLLGGLIDWNGTFGSNELVSCQDPQHLVCVSQ
jgi:hypothetical protein